MKTIQRNGKKFKIFEEADLRENLSMCEKNIVIVMEYQDKFPELMLEDGEGFCINARTLHSQLKLARKFTDWIKPYIKENNSYGFDENVDFTRIHVNVNPTNGVIIEDILFTLNMAKELCMISKSTEGKLCRKYFLAIEDTIRDYKEWNIIRNPEKQKYNEMTSSIKQWCIRNGFDSELKTFYTREADGINLRLTGSVAQSLRVIHNCKDGITRDRLDIETNSAILKLEEYNIMLLDSDMDFESRMNLIDKMCKNKYSHLKK